MWDQAGDRFLGTGGEREDEEGTGSAPSGDLCENLDASELPGSVPNPTLSCHPSNVEVLLYGILELPVEQQESASVLIALNGVRLPEISASLALTNVSDTEAQVLAAALM